MILGFSLVKNIGYKKVHHIEYDCEIRDDFEIEENSKLLDDYDFIYYKDIKENVDDILFGSFQSLKIESLPRDLLILNEDNIKDMIRKSFSKSPEGMFENILINNGKVKVKNRVFFNLSRYINYQLKSLKIKKIQVINKDTINIKNNFFSARRSISRNENDYGRNISVIMIN